MNEARKKIFLFLITFFIVVSQTISNCVIFVILDLTPEQQKLLIELRRRKQELLLEIQVSRRYSFTIARVHTKFFSSDEDKNIQKNVD